MGEDQDFSYDTSTGWIQESDLNKLSKLAVQLSFLAFC